VKYYALGVAYLSLTHFLEYSHSIFCPLSDAMWQAGGRYAKERCPAGEGGNRIIAIHFYLLLFNDAVSNSEVNIRFKVFTAVTMRNVVSWDIKTQFVPHR
jgi:hypothetical protein